MLEVLTLTEYCIKNCVMEKSMYFSIVPREQKPVQAAVGPAILRDICGLCPKRLYDRAGQANIIGNIAAKGIHSFILLR